MTAPNIEAIAASLRNCSLGGRTESSELQPPPAVEVAVDTAEIRPSVVEETVEYDEVTVELNSEVALPYHWEQCLDLRTGEIYYINWKDGTRTTEDPRLTTTRCGTSCCSSDETSDLDDEDADEEDEDYCEAEDSSSSVGEGAGYDDFYGITTEPLSGVLYGASTSTSGSSSSSTTTTSTAGNQVLVAAGCKSCFMYFMVPKRVEACPKCGGCLLHLGRNGYF